MSIHTILYIRKIYPQELFKRARKYNSPVYQCRHPDVCTWVNDAIQGIGNELRKVKPPHPLLSPSLSSNPPGPPRGGLMRYWQNVVEKISFVILSPLDIPLEKFVWDVSGLPRIPAADIDTP